VPNGHEKPSGKFYATAARIEGTGIGELVKRIKETR
jgi:hypothetical protein